jgi:hypothetical protein
MIVSDVNKDVSSTMYTPTFDEIIAWLLLRYQAVNCLQQAL